MKTDTSTKIIKYIKERRQTTAKDLADQLGISPQALFRQLKKLLQKDIIHKTGKPPRVFYSLNNEIDLNKKPVQNKEELMKLLLKSRTDIKKFGIRKLGVFGSFIRNEQKDSSDVDMLVEFQEGQKNYDHFISLASFLEALLSRKIDLLTKESLSRHFGHNILKEAEYVFSS